MRLLLGRGRGGVPFFSFPGIEPRLLENMNSETASFLFSIAGYSVKCASLIRC